MYIPIVVSGFVAVCICCASCMRAHTHPYTHSFLFTCERNATSFNTNVLQTEMYWWASMDYNLGKLLKKTFIYRIPH